MDHRGYDGYIGQSGDKKGSDKRLVDKTNPATSDNWTTVKVQTALMDTAMKDHTIPDWSAMGTTMKDWTTIKVRTLVNDCKMTDCTILD